MKRRDLIRHIEQHGCVFIREGSNLSVYANVDLKKSTAVPRHREINEFMARKICDDLGIDRP